jgi:hypothetical protein
MAYGIRFIVLPGRFSYDPVCTSRAVLASGLNRGTRLPVEISTMEDFRGNASTIEDSVTFLIKRVRFPPNSGEGVQTGRALGAPSFLPPRVDSAPSLSRYKSNARGERMGLLRRFAVAGVRRSRGACDRPGLRSRTGHWQGKAVSEALERVRHRRGSVGWGPWKDSGYLEPGCRG